MAFSSKLKSIGLTLLALAGLWAISGSARAAQNFFWTGNSAGGANWNSTAGGTNWSISGTSLSDPGSVPTSTDSVFFVFKPQKNSSATLLGQDFPIVGLTFNADATTPVGIGGSNLLTIGSGGITVLTGSGAHIISSNLAVNANQLWANNAISATPLTISGVLSGSNAITLSGTGSISIPSGSFVFTAGNTYTGALALLNANANATLSGNGTLLSVSGITLNGGTSLILDNSGTPLTRFANTVPVISNGGTITLKGNASAVTENIGTLTVGSGATAVGIVPNNTTTLTLNNLVRGAGGTINFLPVSASAIVSTPTLAAGLVGPWATVGVEDNSGNLDFAIVSGSQIAPLATYNTGAFTTWLATDNVKNSSTQALTAATTTVNTVYSTTAGILNIAGHTLVIGAGGVIANGGTGTYVVNGNQTMNNASAIGGTGFSAGASAIVAGSTIKAAAGVPDIVFNVSGNSSIVNSGVNTSTGVLQVNAVIADATSTVSGITISTTNNSNVATVTVGTTANIFPGATFPAVAGFPAAGIVTAVTDSTHFTVNETATSTTTGTPTLTTHTGITKTGNGLLDLADGNNTAITNTFAGLVTIDGGCVLVKGDLVFGPVPASAIPNAITLNGGEIRSTAGFTIAANRGITVGPQGGILSYDGGATFTATSKIAGSGGMTFQSISNGGTTTFNLNTAAGGLTYQGPTTLVTKTPSNITFQVANELPATTPVTIANYQGAFGTIVLGANSQTWGSLSSTGTIGTITGTTGGLTLGGTSGSPVNQTASYGGTISGTNLTKNGGGTQTFTNANTYSGTTTINGGKIVVSNTTGSATGTSTVTVANGGALGGSGIITGAVTVNSGGILSPAVVPTGASTLQLSGGLTLNPGTNLNFNLGAINTGTNPIPAPTSDNVFVTGNLAMNTGATHYVINITQVGTGLAAGTYPLITATGTVPASLSGITFDVKGSLQFIYSVSIDPVNKALDLNVSVNPNPSLTWVGFPTPGNGPWDTTTAAWTFTGGSGSTTYADGDNLTFDNTPGATSVITLNTAVNPGSMSFNNNILTNYTFTGTGAITGAGGIVKQNTGTATFNTANTFTGLVDLQNGNIVVGASPGALADTSFAIALGTTLTVNGALTASPPSITNSGTFAVGSTGTIPVATNIVNSGSATFANAAQSLSGLSGTGGITLTGTALTLLGTSNYGGSFGGTGSITTDTTGTLTLSQANTYSGGTTVVSGGTLQVANTTGSATGTGAVLVNSGGTLTGSGTIGGALTVNGTLAPHANITAAGLLAINSNTIINGGSIFNFNFGASGTNDQLSVTGNATLSGAITVNVNPLTGFGAGTFTLINATGTVTNGATYTFVGIGSFVANVSTGTGHQLIVTFAPPQLVWNGSTDSNWNVAANWTPARIPQNNDLVVLTGSGFQPTNFNVNGLTLAGITFDNTTTTPITVTGTGGVTDVSLSSAPAGTLSVNAAAAHVFNPNITMLSPVTASAVTGGSLNLAGVINGAAASSFTAAGPGTITLSNGANAYVGNTTVSGGVLSIASIADGGALSPLGAASSAPGNLTLSGGTLQFTGATGSSNRGITLVGTASIIDVGANALTLNGQVAGTGSFTKNGSGTLTMTNPSSSYANTTENAGQLVATAGGALGTGNVTLNTAKLALNFTQGAGVTNFGGDGTGWTLNGGATVTTDVATLTDGGGSEARSLFFNTPFSYVNGFTANFVYTPSPAGTGTADGVTFCLQNDPAGAAALGAAGGNLGYTVIANSAALEINIFTGAAGGVGISYGTNGTINTNVAVTPVTLNSGDPIQFKVVYSPVTNNFVVTLTDATAVTTATITLANVNLGAVLGSGSAFVGFTGATGGSVATQTIGSFSLTQGNTPAYPNSLVINGNSIVDLSVPSAGTAYVVGGLSMGTGANLTVTANGGAGNNIAYTLAASGNGTLAGTDSINVASNGTSLGTLTLGGILSDGVPAGTLSATGPGVIALSGANTFTGGVNANAGLVRLANAAAGGTGTTIVNPAGTLHLDAGVTSPITLAGGTLENIGNETITGGLTVNSPSTVLPYDAFIGGTTQNDMIETGILHGSGNISIQTYATNNGPDGNGLRLRGAASPDYTGTITVGQAAKFEIEIKGATGSPMGTGAFVLTGGTINTTNGGNFSLINLRNNAGGNASPANNVQLTGSGTALLNLLTGGGQSPNAAAAGSTVTFGSLQIGAGQVLAVSATNTGVLQNAIFGATTLAGGGNATFQAGIPGNTTYVLADGISLGAVGESIAGSSLTANGKGTLTLTANNSYTGPTTIAGGTLQLGTGGTTGNISAAALSMAANTTLLIDHSDSPTLGNAISLTGNTGGQANAGFINVVANSVTLSGGSIASAGEEFWKAGAGTLIVNESGNTYNVSNVVQAGVLQTDTLSNAGSASSLGIGGIYIAQSGTGTLRYSGVSATTDRLGAFALQGTGSSATIDIPNAATVLTVSSALGDLAIPATPNGFTKIGAGTLTLTGTNTYAGATVVSGGTLSVSSDANLGATATPAGVTLGVGTTLQSTGTFSTSRVLTLNGNATLDITSGNALTLASPIAISASSLTKTSAGTLVLSGAQGYTGGTIVNGGTLRGQATVQGAIAINNNASIFPGNAPQVSGPATYPDLGVNQVLSGASISFSASSKLQVVITTDGTNLHSTQVNVTGPATVATGATLTFGIMTATYPTADVALLTSGGAPSITSPFVPGTPPLPVGMSVHYYSGGLPASLGGSGTEVLAPSAVTPADTVVLHSTSGSVTPVKIESFAASTQGIGTMLEWTAISEFQNLGFNVYRRIAEPRTLVSGWTRVNSALISGRITNADAKIYRVYDWAAPGQYEYKLESVSLRGAQETYAKFASATIDANAELSALSADGMDAAAASMTLANESHRSEMLSAKFSAEPRTSVSGNAQEPRPQGSGLANEPRPQGSGNAALAFDAQGNLGMPAVSVRALNQNSASVGRASEPVQSGSANLDMLGSPSYLAGARWFTAGGTSTSASFTGAKVVYSAPGLMLIPQAMLPAGFNAKRVSITREGRAMTALAVTSNGLVVFAPGYQDDYTDKDALFLRNTSGATPAGQILHANNLFAGNQTVNTNSPATVTASYHDVYFDFNLRPFTFAPWFSSQYLTDGTDQSFSVSTPDASSGAASLTVNLWSLTQADGVSPDHALQVLVNGQPAGQATWTGGNTMMQLSFQLASGVLINGANQIDLVTPELNGVSSQVSFLYSLTIGYTKSLDGSAPLDVYNLGAQSQVFEVSNVPSSNAWVVDARYPDRATLVAYESQAQADGSYTLRFNAPSGGAGHYLVVPAGQENLPISVSKRQVKPVKAMTYMPVGPAQFSAAVQPLLLQHAKEGLRGTFVDQEQIFDYYNYGRYGPNGIQNAVRAVRPQYLLLLGRTTYDYKNYSGLGVDPLCPTFLVSATFWAQATSDSMFGDLGRGYPEVAVGRLPVNNASELSNAVKHVLNNTGLSTGYRVHAAADRADPDAGDFAAEADAIAQAHPDVTWQPDYLGVTYQTSPEVTAALTQAANGGADLLMYIGHGNAVRLGNEVPRILDNDSVAAWTGSAVFLQSTCTANWMAKDEAGYQSIAIQALTQPQGGISASIASSTYMNSQNATEFMSQLLTNAGTTQRWGNALLKTQQWAYAKGSGFYADLSNTEQIFGDPAMPIFSKANASGSTPSTAAGKF